MEKYNSPTKGKMHRCWCWTEWKENEKIDNGFKPVTEPYPHSENCRREKERKIMHGMKTS